MLPEPAERAPRRKPRDLRVARRMLIRRRMKDLLFAGVTLAFFALGWLYVRALDRV